MSDRPNDLPDDPMPEIWRDEPCPECGGEGGWSVPVDINRFDGSLIERNVVCHVCEGTGRQVSKVEYGSPEDFDE